MDELRDIMTYDEAHYFGMAKNQKYTATESQTSFVVDAKPNTLKNVTVDGVEKTITVDYTYTAGTGTIEFTEAPGAGKVVQANWSDIELGTVISEMGESSNPTENEKQYIHQKSKTIKVTGFSNEFPITQDLVKNEVVSEYMYNIFRNRKTGSDAMIDHYIVELWNPTNTEGVYKARKITQTVEIEEKSAPAGEQVNFNGSLKGGEFIDGTFNVNTKAFTENA